MPGILGALAFGGLLAGRDLYQNNKKREAEQLFQEQLQQLLGQQGQVLNQGPVDVSQPGSGLIGALDQDLAPLAEFGGGLLGLDGLQTQGGNILEKIISEQFGRANPALPDPTRGTLTTVVGPNGDIRRILVDPTNGQPIADLGEAPKPSALVEINEGPNVNRDLPAGQASDIGDMTDSLQKSQGFLERYQPEFSNVGVDILGGAGSTVEMFLDRVRGENVDRTAFWNDIEEDKTAFTKARFGGNASDRDRETVNNIYPNPRFDDATNQRLLSQLQQNKQNILQAKTRALENAGFDVDRRGGGGAAPIVDFDLTK